MYSQIARARRRYYVRRPHLRRRLSAPVISIGNLTVGGSGKTPLAAEIARMLLAMGERPAILSRGYARAVAEDGVVIVSDGSRVLTGVERSGDEPQMLARAVPGAAVLVSASRYVAGRIAEGRLGCTVHVLDDGFQHFDLMRDVDLLVSPDPSEGTRTLPFGRLREPLDAASAADALLVEVEDRAEALCHQTVAPEGKAEAQCQQTVGLEGKAEAQCHQTVALEGKAEAQCQQTVGLEGKAQTVEQVAQDFSPVLPQPRFTFSRRLAGPPPDRPAFAFAGIAKPERFFSDLEKAGWTLTGRRTFGDHHHYSEREIDELLRAAASSGAAIILTTEKDRVRIAGRPQIVAVPLEIAIEPAFAPWLAERLRAVRAPGAA